MTDGTACAWRADVFGGDALNVGVVGQQEADIEDLPELEQKAFLQSKIDSFNAFMGTEPLPAEMVPGPVFSVSNATYYSGDGRLRNRGETVPKAPPPVMIIGYPAVTAECRAVLERHDLGETEFYPVTVLNAERTEPFWPEVHLMRVRNRKSTIDVEASMAEGTVRQAIIRDHFRRTFEARGLEVPKRYSPIEGRMINLEAHALDGPEVWFEEIVGAPYHTNFYISDALKQDLEREGMLAPWRVIRAPIRQA